MARRPSRREDAVTTEPVPEGDDPDAFVGGMDLGTAILIFCFLGVVLGIGLTAYELKTQYDSWTDDIDKYQGKDPKAREREGWTPEPDPDLMEGPETADDEEFDPNAEGGGDPEMQPEDDPFADESADDGG